MPRSIPQIFESANKRNVFACFAFSNANIGEYPLNLFNMQRDEIFYGCLVNINQLPHTLCVIASLDLWSIQCDLEQCFSVAYENKILAVPWSGIGGYFQLFAIPNEIVESGTEIRICVH